MANSKEYTPPVIFAAQQEVPISRLDIRGHLLACNDAYLALSGYARDARESREDVVQVQTALRRICEEVGQISGLIELQASGPTRSGVSAGFLQRAARQ